MWSYLLNCSMCGRSSASATAAEISAEATHALGSSQAIPWKSNSNWSPRANICPGHCLPILVRDPSTGAVHLETMAWGLVPSFTPPGLSKPDFFRLFNGRSETCGDLPSFRGLVACRRCVALLSGFGSTPHQSVTTCFVHIAYPVVAPNNTVIFGNSCLGVSCYI